MRIFLRVLRYPATLMTIIAAIYVVIAIPTQSRLQIFGMLALTALGATELALAIRSAVQGQWHSAQGLARIVTGAGALVLGYSGVSDVGVALTIFGCGLLAAGLILNGRVARLS